MPQNNILNNLRNKATKSDAAQEIYLRDLTSGSCLNWLLSICMALASAFGARPKISKAGSSEGKRDIK